jgi:thymidylate synthase (FAD)
MPVKLIWFTQDGDQLIADMARVSNPSGQGKPADRLIRYLLANSHWSPFEMVNACFEITTTRDIGRQLLRHWTLRPQEFSQRYAAISEEPAMILRECRLQHPTNRQASVETNDEELKDWWRHSQLAIIDASTRIYNQALDRGIAKEVARVILPEGITPTRIYFNGNLRSWLHFCELRSSHGTQKETTEIALEVWGQLRAHFPSTTQAFASTLEDGNPLKEQDK